MNSQLLILSVLIGLVGCNAIAQDSTQPSSPNTQNSSPSPNVITSEDGQAQGRFKIRLSLTAPDDLKVKEGDVIIAGQIIADRVRDRTRLSFEKDSLTREIGLLRKRLSSPLPGVKPLPKADFQEESARIETARQSALELIRQREQQQRKMDVLANLEPGEVPEEITAHEQVVLDEYQRQENQAQAEVQAAIGKLERSKELRQEQEYTHSLEMSKRAIAIRDSELKTQGQVSDLEARLSQIEISLSQLSAVRSPYSGTIQRIKFVGQSDTALTVELFLVIASSSPK
ncbi:MAG: hypothetical protein NW224_12065 [Leptolyngbyaceae cyanobacterium bins.302]|nr:hypothetical protein [Leptolyngbyaceae cyanobacterium bins.302]